MKANIVALHCRLSIAERMIIKTESAWWPPSPSCCISITTKLCSSRGGKESGEREGLMDVSFLYRFFSVREGGVASPRYIFLGHWWEINSLKWIFGNGLFASWFSNTLAKRRKPESSMPQRHDEIEFLARLPPCLRHLLCPSHPGLFFVSLSFADLYFVSTEDIPMCITSLETAPERSTCTYTWLQPRVGENCSEFYNTGLELIKQDWRELDIHAMAYCIVRKVLWYVTVNSQGSVSDRVTVAGVKHSGQKQLG